MYLTRQHKGDVIVTPGTWYAITVAPAVGDGIAVFASQTDAREWATARYAATTWQLVEVTIG